MSAEAPFEQSLKDTLLRSLGRLVGPVLLFVLVTPYVQASIEKDSALWWLIFVATASGLVLAGLAGIFAGLLAISERARWSRMRQLVIHYRMLQACVGALHCGLAWLVFAIIAIFVA